MIKKTIKFRDFNGEPASEDLYFHLTKAEVLELELSEREGWEASMNKLIESENTQEILKTFKDILKKAYGLRSEDGTRFIKSDQISEEWSQRESFSELIWQFFLQPESAGVFFGELQPKGLDDAPERRTDGRPAVQDHQPKAQATSAPVFEKVEDAPQELMVTSEPAMLPDERAEYEAWKASRPAPGGEIQND